MVCVDVAVKRTVYQRRVDVDMLNAVKGVLADVSSVSPSSEQRLCVFSSVGVEFKISHLVMAGLIRNLILRSSKEFLL